MPRPWFLVAALLLTYFVGFHGLAAGCGLVAFLRGGSVAEVSQLIAKGPEGADPLVYLLTVAEAARLEGLARMHTISFPLGAARLVLAGLLVFASAVAMSGRPGSRKLVLQAVAANALLAIADYALTRGVRAVTVEAVVTAAALLPDNLSIRPEMTTPGYWWFLSRVRFLVLDLGALALAGLALTRPKARDYFDVAAILHRQRAEEEEDEP